MIPLCLKFETSAHARVVNTSYYLFTNLRNSWQNIKLKLRLGILFYKWSWSMILSHLFHFIYSLFLKTYSSLKLKTVLLRQVFKVYTFISILHKMFLNSYCLMVWWWLQMKGRLLANVSNKETEWVFAQILHFSFIFKIF